TETADHRERGNKQPLFATRGEQEQRSGPDQIELLLDSECPGVEQRCIDSVAGEISAFAPKEDIGHAEGRPDRGSQQSFEESVRQDDGSCDERAGKRHQQGWKNSPYATHVEIRERESSPFPLTANEARNQKSADNEENVDA